MTPHNFTHDIVAVFRKDVKQVVVQLFFGKGPAFLPLSGLPDLEDKLRGLEFNLVGKGVSALGFIVGSGQVKFDRPTLIAEVIHPRIAFGQAAIDVEIAREGWSQCVHLEWGSCPREHCVRFEQGMSVFDEDEIKRLCQVYARDHPKESSIDCSRSAEDVWKDLQTRLASKCKTGRAECIVSSLLRRPRAPKEWTVNREEWLSSDDIDAVEKNFSDVFVDYYYVGSVPIDFDLKDETRKCIVSTLCSLNLTELSKRGKHQIGIVINTDTHDGPGQHWVAVFCDIRPELEYPRITYFDSYAHVPESEIKTLMKRWKREWDATGVHSKPMKLTFNKTRHQFKDSECGMYCLYFHYACLIGLPMHDRIPDDVINAFRNLLFRMPGPNKPSEKE